MGLISEYEEEKRLPRSSRCEDSYRLSLFLVDNGLPPWRKQSVSPGTMFKISGLRSGHQIKSQPHCVPIHPPCPQGCTYPAWYQRPFSMLNQVRFRQI